MSDWGEAAIIESFPSVGDTYFIQFIIEPELKDCVSKDGRKYQQVVLRLQFLTPNDQTGAYEYLGWGEIRVQPCVLKGFLLYRSLILTSMFEVKGIPHKRHVDLEIIETHPLVSRDDLLTDSQKEYDAKYPTNPPLVNRDAQSGPLKTAATQPVPAGEGSQVDSSSQGQAGAGDSSTSHPEEPPANCTHEHAEMICEYNKDTGALNDQYWKCKSCGERVG